jgi:short subunit dehydrogenase-like uncharacterized protein
VATIAVLGAGGQTGRLAVAELRRAGHRVVALGTVARPVEGAASGDGDTAADEHRAASDEAAGLAAALHGIDALIDVAGPYAPRGGIGLEAALLAGVHHLDASLEPTATAHVHEQDERARSAGITTVSAGGFPAAVLDLLGLSALAAVDGASELHLATTFPGSGWWRHGAGPATRRILADLLVEPMTAVVDGEPTDEPIGEARRLAWFPRPVGLAHAAGVPSTAVLSVHRRDPGLATVREYLAMSGWRAELLQLAAGTTGWAPARRWLHRRVQGPATGPDAARRGAVRWACVAETRGEQGTVRAWANGHDPAATSAACLAVLTDAVLAHGQPGAHTPAQLAPSGRLLDELTASRDLRWAVIRPEPTGR